jgi:endonuclease/exonuclease/phosphatase family metal-dependent hydrolase
LAILVILTIGYKQLNVVFAFHPNNTFSEEKATSSIRIIDWNLRGFNGISEDKISKRMLRPELAESILKLNPDIVCFQEFNHSYNSISHPNESANNIGLFIQALPYYYFSKDYKSANGYASGSIIFSRFPIIDTGILKFSKGESALFVDVVNGKDTFRVYTTHLQSFKFKKTDYNNIEKVETNDSLALSASKNIFEKMKPAFTKRASQVNLLKEWVSKSPHPNVITGDFNDVPNSYAYFSIRGNRQDAFLQKSFGIGRTFISLAPTLRIDYILPDNNFEVKQFDLQDEGLSDHYMLITDLQRK